MTRKSPNTLSHDFVAEAARLVGVESSARIVLMKGGYSNANYLVETNSERFVLRIYRDPKLARREQLIHELVQGAVPVARILKVVEDPAAIGSAFCLMEYVAGSLLEEIVGGSSDSAVQAGREVGEVLAAFGRFRFADAGYFDESLHPTGSPKADRGVFEYVEDQLGRGGDATGLSVADRGILLEILDRELPVLARVGAENCLVHCDFNPKNLIMRPSGGSCRVAAVLDWEFAFSGSQLWDVANMFRWGNEYPPEYCSGFVDGFQEAGGSLPEGWQLIGRIMDAVNLAEFASRGPGHRFWKDSRDLLLSVVKAGTFA